MSRRIRIWSFADVDRSGKVRWTAHELGYAVEEVRVGVGEHARDPYRQLNPYGMIPSAEIDGETLVESTAICLALADRHPEAALIPEDRVMRDRFWQSVSVCASTLETPTVLYYLSKRGFVDAAWASLWEESLQARLPVLAAEVPDQGFICGEFSLADICAAYVLRIGVQSGLLPMEGALAGYLGNLMARPAARAARFFDGFAH
jgi:glutathione S-transferase